VLTTQANEKYKTKPKTSDLNNARE